MIQVKFLTKPTKKSGRKLKADETHIRMVKCADGRKARVMIVN